MTDDLPKRIERFAKQLGETERLSGYHPTVFDESELEAAYNNTLYSASVRNDGDADGPFGLMEEDRWYHLVATWDGDGLESLRVDRLAKGYEPPGRQ